MLNVHYDLEKVERDTRKMFDEFQPKTPQENFLKGCVDVQVHFTRQILLGIMKQNPAEELFQGAAFAIAEIMLNMTNHFSGAPKQIVLEMLMDEIGRQIAFTLSQPDGAVRHTTNVSPATSGSA